MNFSWWNRKDNGNGRAAVDATPPPADNALSESLGKLEALYAAWRPKLLKMVDELNSISKHTEDEFLAIGMRLQTFSNGCSDNSNRASSMAKMIEDGSGLNVNKFRGLFEQAHGKVGSCAEVISNGISGMVELKSRIDDILELKAFLKKLAHSISVLGTLMRIETARVGNDEFTVMTAAVDDLAGEIEKENIEIETYAKTAKAGLTSSSERMASSADKFIKDLTVSRGHVHEILEEMDRMIMQSQQACKRMEGRTAQISPEVGNVVSALQYHDICRQQMEHIGDVLKDVGARSSALHAGEEDAMLAFNRWAVEALHIQISQLENVIVETDASAEGISSHLRRISDLAEAQAEDAGMLLEADESGSRRIAKIGAELGSLSDMLAANRTMVLELSKAISDVADTIGNLSRQVANIELISESINLLALNTIVKVSRTGNAGRGLEVLAGEIRKLSSNANDEIDKGAEVIRGILATSAEFKETISEQLDRELASTDKIFQQTRSSAQELLDAEASMMKALTEISANTKELESEIMRLISGIRFDDIIRSSLGAMAADLRAMVGELGTHTPAHTPDIACGAGAAPPKLHELTNRYTMNSERKIHEETLNSIKGEGSGTSGTQSVSAGSELGDNVELF